MGLGSCFCLRARPGSPNAELVVKGPAGAKLGKAAQEENREPREGLIPAAFAAQEVDCCDAAPPGPPEPGAAAAGPRLEPEASLLAESSGAPLLAGRGAGDASSADGGGGAVDVAQPGGDAAAADWQRASSRGGGPAAEGSQAALLPADEASHASLRHPHASHLSSLFSSSSSGAGDGGQQRGKQAAGGSRGTGTPQVTGMHFDAAAAQLALEKRAKLLPLPQPEQALADAAGMLGRHEGPMLLAALLTLRRVAIHHHSLLASSLPDVAALLLECLHGSDAAVAQAAAMCLLDLFISFGSAMLRVLGPPPPTEDAPAGALPLPSCLLGLLLAAALGRTPAIRFWANEALSWMAQRMHQGRVLALLEPFLEHSMPAVRQVASLYLMKATYRPPDRPTPASPTRYRG